MVGSSFKGSLSKAVRDAVRDAKTNLQSLTGEIEGKLGQIVDEQTRQKLAGLGDSDQAKRLRESVNPRHADIVERMHLAAHFGSHDFGLFGV